MLFTNYRPPVLQLLELGNPLDNQEEISYRALGLGEADVPELCRLAQEGTLYYEEADDFEAYGSVHAWRALGELKAEDAIDTLVGEFRHAELDDWAAEELPIILAQIGPSAILALSAYIENSRGTLAGVTAAESLKAIAIAHPATREQCVTLLAAELARYAEQAPEVNALLMGFLIDLVAVEHAPLMEQAFAAEAIDLSVQGDWEDVQIALGLLGQRLTPQPDYYGYSLPMFDEPRIPTLDRNVMSKAKKNKRKQQAKSRKQNRKKK
ncbi:MAG: hypothetical protein ACRERY_13570 [Pseudomonas sp.]